MPAHRALQPVDVFLELPAEPALAAASRARHQNKPRPRILRGGMEQLLDQPQFPVPAGERRLESVDPLRAATSRHHLPGSVQPERRTLALERVLALVDVVDRRGRQLTGRVVDPDRAGRGQRLHPRGRVDRVTGHHALARCAEGDRHLAGHNADPQRQRGRQLLTQGGDHVGEVQPGPYAPLGVVLVCHRHAPDRHHRVPNELFHRAAVALHDGAGSVEVPRQQLADLLGIAVLRQRGEPDQVTEQHRRHPAFGHARGWDLPRWRRNQGRATARAEPTTISGCSAGGAGGWREGGTAVAAESRDRTVVVPTARARPRHGPSFRPGRYDGKAWAHQPMTGPIACRSTEGASWTWTRYAGS